MRWGQLVFVEDDPGKYDPQFWLDYFKRTHCDGVCLGGGDYMAFYPTEVPYHHRSRWLGNLDLFGELAALCRKAGMIVVARTDPHATYDDAAKAHSDWIAVDADGKPRRHWANAERWVTCDLGPYNFEFMTAVTKEIVRKYRVDGVFANRWADTKMCYCRNCHEMFRRDTKFELPRTPDPQDPARRAHIQWRENRLLSLVKLWDDSIREINPEACFIANSGGGATSALDMSRLADLSSILFADRQGRRGDMSPWANGKNAKEYRATMGRKPIGGIFSVGVEEPYRWKDSVQNASEIKLWAIDGIAHGLRPWFAKFNGKPIDRRWLKPVEEIYDWHWRNEAYLRNERPLATVAIVYSQQTARFYGGQQMNEKVEHPIDGFYQALVEARIPFEMVHDRKLDEESLRPYRTLILPNIAALSDAQCAQLRAFVKRGGNLVATHETSLYDEWGKQRSNFGLADLFGCAYGGKVLLRMQNAYLTLRHGARHPLLKDLEDAPRIIHAIGRVEVKATANPQAPLTLVPSYPDLPMEDVYARVPETDIAQVFLSTHPGRVVYLPFNLDRTYWELLHGDHGILLRNAIQFAHGEPQPVTIAGPGFIDVAVWEQKSSMTVHLVNLTNPMAMRGSIREVIELPGLDVTVRPPAGFKVKAVKTLVSRTTLTSVRGPNGLQFRVPKIGLHEVVAIDRA